MDLIDEIKDKLSTKKWRKVGSDSSGCISKGETYETDNGLVFLKKNDSESASDMFFGELESLKAMESTHTVRVPHPICVVSDPRGAGGAFVVEYLQMSALRQHSGRLGELLAQMHLHNKVLEKKKQKNESWVGKNGDNGYVDRFGFEVTTCCGIIPQNNEWCEDWVQFFARNRIQYQIDMIQQKEGNRELNELWSELQIKIGSFFNDINEPIIPALIHGDLWSGNTGQTAEEPVIFDPSSFYAHSEFELAIVNMFGGFNRNFFECYHNKIAKSKDFDRRNDLYQIFHYLNHWNHFGGGYKHQALALMRKCIKSKPKT